MSVSNFVKSVEHVYVSLDVGVASTAVELTKGQDYNNCIPFHTVIAFGDYFSYRMTDVYFSGTTESGIINFSRSSSGVLAQLDCYIVEFEPAEVKVQQGTFNSSSSTVTVDLPAAVSSVNKSLMTHAWKCSDGSQNYYNHAVRGRVTSSGTLDFHRGATGGTCTGHWFLAEDLGDNYYVHHLNNVFSSTGQTVEFGNGYTVDPLRTFVFASWSTSNSTNYPNRSFPRNFLYSAGSIRSDRTDASYTIYAYFQVFEFTDHSKVYTPFYNHLPPVTSSTTLTYGGSSTRVPFLCNPETTSVVYAGAQGGARLDTTNASYVNETSVRVSLTASGTLAWNKDGATVTTYPSYTSAVDWAGITVDVGTNYSPIPEGDGPEESFVKSVENFTIAIDNAYGAYVLTKGQDWRNCLVLSSHRTTSGADYWSQHAFNVTLYEPGIVYARRWGTDGTGYIEVSVVEFWPNQVKVQHGTYYTGGNTTGTIPIEPVSDVNKAFIVFKQFLSSSSANSSNALYRVSFATTSGIELYKVASGYEIDISYFVVEDLGNNFETRHRLSSSSAVPDRWYQDELYLGRHNTFVLTNYACSCTDTYPNRNFVRSYYTNELNPVYTERTDGSYTVYSYSTIVLFTSNKYRTHPIAVETSSSTYTGTYSSRMTHPNAISAFNNMAISCQRVDTTNSSYFNEAFVSVQVTDYDTRTFLLVKSGASASSHGSGYIIDWIGGHYQYENNISKNTPTKSLVQSVEKFSYYTSGRFLVSALTKGQNIEKCVPFYSTNNVCDDNYMRGFKHICRYADPDIFTTTHASSPTGDRNSILYIVEFSDDIKIQHNLTYLPSSSVVTVTIDTVNLNRAFLHFYYSSDSWSENGMDQFVCGYFIDDSTIAFRRAGTDNTAFVSWYVIECPDDDAYWNVRHQFDSSDRGGSSIQISMERNYNLSRSMVFMSFSSTNNNNYPGRNFFRTYRDVDADVRMDRSDGSYGVSDTNVEVVELGDYLYSKGFRSVVVPVTLNSTTYSNTFTIQTQISGLDTRRTIAITSNPGSHGRSDTSTVGYSDEAFHYYEIQDDGSTLYALKSGGNANSYSHAYIYQFPEPNAYYMEGYVKEQGHPVAREVRAYRASNGELVDKTMSRASDGYFLVETRYTDAHYVVCLDDEDGVVYNDLVFGRMYPVIIEGCWWHNEGLTVSGLAASIPKLRSEG